MKAIRIALVGCGRWSGAVRPALEKAGAIVDGFDADPTRGKPMPKLPRSTWESNNLWRGFDAVCVTAPAEHHYEIAIGALLARKHTLVTKPLALSVAQARNLRDVAREQGVVLMTDLTFLHHFATRVVGDAIRQGDSGELGAVVRVESHRINTFFTGPDPVWDLAPHPLAIWHSWFGPPKRLHLERCGGATGHVFATYAGGVACHEFFSGDNPERSRKMTVVGKNRTMQIVGDDVHVYKGPHHVGSIYPAGQPSALEAEAAHFMACIRGEAEPIGDGVANVEQLEALIASQVHDAAEVA